MAGSALLISAVVGAVASDRASKRGERAFGRANRDALEEQRAARQQFLETTQPFVDFGLEARDDLRNLLSNPQAGIEEINPVVSILRDQGFEQIQETAAAGGRLGAGGTLQDLTQFNSDLATVAIPALQNQRFNQLFNVLSLGSNAAAGQATGVLSTANNISNLQTQFGRNRAEGIVDRSNIFTNALGNFAEFAGQQQANNLLIESDVDEVFSGDLF